MSRREPRAVRRAYAYADTTKPCPNCGAAPHVWCQTPASTVRWMPCVSRLQAPLDAEVEDEDDDAPRPDLRIVPNTYEPRHSRDGDEEPP